MSPTVHIGLVVPSTNTVCEADAWALVPEDTRIQTARISISNMAIDGDDAFDRLVRVSAASLDAAVDRVMDTAPSVVIVGMSSLLVWDGFEAASARRVALAERIGVPVTGGSFALLSALDRMGARRISVVSPYQPVADRQIAAFFEGAGLSVVAFESLRCPSPRAIADVPPDVVSEALERIDSPDVDALVQFGTNLDFRQRAAVEWTRKGKPVLAINTVALWHALRLLGRSDPVDGMPGL